MSTMFDDDAGRRREMRALERQIETSVDALKLLYLIDRYTGGSRGVDDEFVGDFKGDDVNLDGRRMDSFASDSRVDLRRVRARSHVFVRLRAAVDVGFGACSRHLNVCQGGKDGVDDLRECGNRPARLKVTSKAYDHATLLGISKAGKEFLHRVVVSGTLSVSMRRSVDALVRGANRELLPRGVRSTRERFLSRDVVVARSEHGNGHRGRAVREFTVLPGVFSVVRRLQHQ